MSEAEITALTAFEILYDDPDLEAPEWLPALTIKNIPRPDFPHERHHSYTVRHFAVGLGQLLRLSPVDLAKLRLAAELHDMSYGFVVSGQVPYEEHHWAAELLAYMIFRDREVAEGIWDHLFDRLYPHVALWVRLLRDADRLAGMGWSGIIREAYYLGFLAPLLPIA